MQTPYNLRYLKKKNKKAWLPGHFWVNKEPETENLLCLAFQVVITQALENQRMHSI